MALKSLKDKLASVAGGETLGDASAGEKERKPSQPKTTREPKPSKPSKPKKQKAPKIKKAPLEKKVKEISTKRRHSIFNSRSEEEEETFESIEEIEEEEEEKSQSINTVRDSIEGYQDVLSILGVKESLEIDADFTSDELDYIEFTQTQPLGFDFAEVTDFISRTKYTMHKLESALSQRDRDIVKVASQVKRVEQKMVEANQAKELERMIGGMTAEERLIEENMELKVSINELNREIKSGAGSKKVVSRLEREIESLKVENDMLKMEKSGSNNKGFNNTQDNKHKLPNKLPSFEDKSDMFEGMLKDIGGLDDE